MPFPINTYFDPSDRLRELWSLAPQVRTLQVVEKKTKAYHSGLSSAVIVFYLLMILAIAFDIYLGFFILSKQGVNLGLIVGSVIADLFLGVLPFLMEGYFFKSLNHTKVENSIFLKELESKSRILGETDEAYRTRKARIENHELPRLYSSRSKVKIYRIVIALVIFGIAAWKIYTFQSVLPPSLSIWAVVKGKIIIIFSVLTAVFHLIGTEKAVAHLFFSTSKKAEYKRHLLSSDGIKPEPESRKIEFKGNFREVKKGNSSIVKRGEEFFLEFIHVINDGEIQALVNAQTDTDAKRVVALKCKENQLI